MLKDIAYYLIFGKPLIMYMGIMTLLAFLITAYIGFMKMRGKTKIPLRYHFLMAKIAVTLALVHATLGLSSYF